MDKQKATKIKSSRSEWQCERVVSNRAEAIVFTCAFLMALVLVGRYLWAFPFSSNRLVSLCLTGVLVGIAFKTVRIILSGKTAKAGGWVCLTALSLLFITPISELCQRLIPGPFDVFSSLEYTITVNEDLRGADIWVNDVHLGKSPVTMERDAFLAKVPAWPETPEGMNHVVDATTHSRTSQRFMGWVSNIGLTKWMRLPIPEVSKKELSWQMMPAGNPEGRFYVRVKYGACQGYGGNARRDSDEVAKGVYRAVCNLDISFPQCEQRISDLMDWARINDYQVGSDWFTAMESYADRAWRAVESQAYRLDWEAFGPLKKQVREPEMETVLDQWATWHYLREVRDPDSAWRAWQTLLREADRTKRYRSDSLQGRAVQLVIRQIDPARFVRWAMTRIKHPRFKRFFGLFVYNNVTPLKYSHRDHPPYVITPRPSDYVVVDAIRALDTYLDQQDNTVPNRVEETLAPALVAWHGHSQFDVLMQAVLWECPVVKPFLLSCWQRQQRRPASHRLHANSMEPDDVSLWLFLLAHLRGEPGRQFRAQHEDALQEMATTVLKQQRHRHRILNLDFLFLEAEIEGECLGLRFWPQFSEFVRSDSQVVPWDHLEVQWQYLLAMEPASPIEAYVTSWRLTPDKESRDGALVLLSAIPPAKRELIIATLQQEVSERPENIKKYGTQEPSPERAKAISRRLDALRSLSSVQAFVDCFTADSMHNLLQGWGYRTLRNCPRHPYVEGLARSPSDYLKLTAIRVIDRHPIPEHLTLLKTLTTDTSKRIRTRAQGVWQRVEMLNKTPLSMCAAEARARLGIFGEDNTSKVR